MEPTRGRSGAAIGRCSASPSRRMDPLPIGWARIEIARASSSSTRPKRRIEVRPSRTTR